MEMNGDLVGESNSSGREVAIQGAPLAARAEPVTHLPVDAPLCANCQQLDLEFFDPSCPGCREILNHSDTSIAQIFACLRQWVPQTQKNIEGLVQQVLDRGAHINDRDGLTDMTLLHFACKAGASGVGDSELASKTVQLLLAKGANVNLKCKWTQMTSLHYAAYFDAAPIIHLLLNSHKNNIDINSTCAEYNNGTALHIAAGNLCLESARALIQFGAKLNIRDSLGRTPMECIPNDEEFVSLPHVRDIVKETKCLFNSVSSSGHLSPCSMRLPSSLEPVSGRALLRSMGLTYGSRVLINRTKPGFLRFCGTTEFAMGLWVGVELDCFEGKNDGSVNGVVYFRCAPNKGLFVPVNKISKYMSSGSVSPSSSRKISSPRVNILYKHSKLDFSQITSKIESGLSFSSRPLGDGDNNNYKNSFKLGERVLVNGNRKGTVRYFGTTKFASGNWYGVELDQGDGKNDGSVDGHRYFNCQAKYGVFALPSKLSRLLTYSADNLSNLPDFSLNNNQSSFKRTQLRMSLRITHPNRSPRNGHGWLSNNMSNSWSPSLNSGPGPRLNVGVKVLVHNQLGVVRYVGDVEFTDGTWVGVELSSPQGKHDGSVRGKRYFTCKPGHGLLVRPQRVSLHGINGVKLLQE